MNTKICNICSLEKFEDDFYKKNACCKVCHLLKKQEWRKNNPKLYKEQTKKYYEKSKDVQNKKKKIWIEKNREKYNSYWRRRKKEDTNFNLLTNMRSRLTGYLKKLNISKKNKTFEIVGCTPQELKEHLEKQFVEGMTWDNRNGWHIDHIVPLSSAKTEEEFYELCHFTNLQPLWAIDNIKKRDKIVEPIKKL